MQPIQFFAARAEDGALLPGATVDVFVSGSNVRADVFAKADTELPIANPLTSDGNARVFFYTREPRIDIKIRRGGYVAPMMEGIVTVDPQDALLAAEAAMVRAEAAANSAQVAAQIYPDIASGLAATLDGRYFSVISSGVEEFLILYRKVAGVAVEIKRYPSADAISSIRELIDNYSSEEDGVALEVNDASRRFTLLKLMVDGTLDLLGAQLSNSGDGLEISDFRNFIFARLGAAESNINGLVTQPSDQAGIEFVGGCGFVAGRFDSEGAFFGPSRAGQTQVLSTTLELDRQQRTDQIHIIGYGQSKGRGAFSLPIISTVQPYNNLMLVSGTKIRAGEPGYNASSYVPLVETVVGDDGEAPVLAMCNGVVRRAVAAGEKAVDWVLIASSPGMGGQSVESLGPGGTGYYEKTIQLIKDHAALSKSLGKTYSVWAYTWTQGEANYSTTGSGATATKSAYQYAQLQLELFDAMSREIAQITGQKFRPYLFTYQVAAHRRYSSDTMQIALAQWRASRMRPDVVMAVPDYIFPVYTDNLHLTNEGSWLLGEYYSRAMHETMVHRSGKWRPLEPVTVDWRTDHIDIKFHVPGGQLVLDTALAAAAPNFGFDIREFGAVVTNLISVVDVTGSDTVRLTLSRAAHTDAVLSYARGRLGDAAASGPVVGARGNLRDTHGLYDTATSPLGNTFALHNPCVMFEFNRKTGF